MKPITLILVCFLTATAYSQTSLNLELQVYPTGIIPGVRIEKQVGNKTLAHLRVGLNIFDHRDLGVQDEESGAGYGFTLGVSRLLKKNFELGIRNDIWFNNVDWVDNTGPSPFPGETSITVLQPTIELGYRHQGERLIIKPTLAFGLEWNVITDGEPTGEGPIVLVGVIIGKSK